MLNLLASSYRRTLTVALLTGSLLVLPGVASATAGGGSATGVHASSSAKHKKRGKCSKLRSKKARKKCVAQRREDEQGITAPMPPLPTVESPVPVPVPTDPGAVLPS